MNYSLQTFSQAPYSLKQKEKNLLLHKDMQTAALWHYKSSKQIKHYYDHVDFNPNIFDDLAEIPYVPATIFKTVTLKSVPDREIIKTLHSSSTSGIPSTVFIDQITADYQKKAVMSILSDFLGKERRHFVIFDTPQTIKTVGDSELNSRGTAIRGMLPLAKSFTFLLNEKLEINETALNKQLTDKNSALCFFGFTWLTYNIYKKYSSDKKLQKILKSIISKDKKLLHIGGWKKLTDIAVSKAKFNKDMSTFLNTKSGNIIDIYGMTEQLGTVYPDCEYGFKHVPLFSEIIIRDRETLEELPPHRTGFIELISPIPHSYPGIAILSDDLGKIEGIDSCKCGRMGKYFSFEKRSEKAELRGCGDTLQL